MQPFAARQATILLDAPGDEQHFHGRSWKVLLVRDRYIIDTERSSLNGDFCGSTDPFEYQAARLDKTRDINKGI